MPDNDLTRRVEEIEQRLAALEAKIGVAATPERPVPTERLEVEIPLAQPVPRRTAPPPLPRPVSTQAAAPVSETPKIALPEALIARRSGARPSAAPPLKPLEYQATAPPPVSPVREGSLEQTIGLKWAGWIGAVVLVIALGLGIKNAYDNGWFGVVPTGVKLLILWLGSFSLIGAGEYVYRKINRISAAGLFGAGLAMLFVVSYAGHGYFGAYTKNTAFVLMAASTIVGALVAMRGKMVSIAALTLIGGNIAPIVLSSRVDDYKPFFFYLLMLQITALFLAWWGGTKRWWTLRGLSLATTAFWSLVSIGAALNVTHVDPRGWPLLFVLLFAALFHLEVILSALSRRAGTVAGAVFVMLVTAVLSVGVYLIHIESTAAVRGAWLAGIAAVCAAMGFVCRALDRTGKQGGMRDIAVSYAAQAAILVVVAVPVACTGWAVLGGWAALSIGFAVVGGLLDLNVPRRAAAVTWGLCVGYLAWWLDQNWETQRTLELLKIGETIVPQYLLAALLLAVGGHLIAFLIRLGERGEEPRGEFKFWQTAVQAVAGLVWAIAALVALPPLGATVCIIAYAWLCAVMDIALPKLRLAYHAAGALAVAAAKWAVVDMISARLSTDYSPTAQTLVLNPAMGVGVLIAFSFIAIYLLRKPIWDSARDEKSSGLFLVSMIVLAIMTLGLSLEVDRAVEQAVAAGKSLTLHKDQTKLLALTMLWSLVTAAVMGLTAWLKSARAAANAGVALVLILAIKLVVVDTLGFRFTHGVGTAKVVANLQFLAGIFVFGIVTLAWWLARSSRSASAAILTPVLVMLPWWIVTMEVDRWAAGQTIAQPWMARQVGWSIWWSIYAILMVIAGFRVRTSSLRYLGLAMFAVTLLKVVLVDLSTAATGLRILSFLGLGILLLATSVLYGKLSPKLLGEVRNDNAT